MSLPVGDWQFWAVTALALGAAWYVFREVIPIKWLRRKPKGKGAQLTVGGKAVETKKK